MLDIPRLRPELERPLVQLASEKRLGQRWTVVRCMGLPGDHADRSVVAVAAQRLARALGSETAAGDHNSSAATANGRQMAHGHSIRRGGETPVSHASEAAYPSTHRKTRATARGSTT